MNTIRTLAMQWFNELDTYNKSELSHKYYKETISYNFTSLTGREIENIFYNDVVLVWYNNQVKDGICNPLPKVANPVINDLVIKRYILTF
jgi:hypothetical protein